MSSVRSRAEVLELVKQWPREEQVEFAEEILAERPRTSEHSAARPLRDLLGIAAVDGIEFSDEDLDRIVEEERTRRLGA